MTLPEQISDVPEEREAYAPYNFVPLPEKVVSAQLPLPDHDRYYPSDERHTGRIVCTLTTATPLYVRCGYTPEEYAAFGDKAFHELPPEEKHQRAQFFHHNDSQRPVIPGSSLRGMLRALVEIAGYGKMDKVMGRGLVYRAVGDTTSLGSRYRERLMREDRPRYYTPLMQAGYIERQGSHWQIRPAQQINGTTFARIWIDALPTGLQRWKTTRNANEIYIQPGPYDYKAVRGGFLHIRSANVLRASASAATGLVAAVVARSGHMFSKKREAVIFAKDSGVATIEIPDWMVTAYREQITKEQQTLLGSDGVLQPDQPVFYLIENDELVFFGHAMMLRLPYRLSPRDFIPSKLREKTQIDIAEAVFGVVHPPTQERQEQQVIAGRVFVSDATLASTPDGLWYNNEPITPHILGSPKPTTFQHYLVQIDPAGEKRNLKDYASRPDDETVIRGHKLYWHKGLDPNVVMTSEELRKASDTQTTNFRPVKAGVIFHFSVHFENLTNVELGALLWVLNIAADERYRLKLGMGKPLGMGAVAITHEVWLSDRAARYQRLLESDEWASGERSMRPDEESDRINVFGQYVLKESGESAKGYTQLSGTLRMGCLLALLSWPGPNPKATRYMEIERDARHPDGTQPGHKNNTGKVNEYSNRLVLPTPTQVMEEHGPPQNTPQSRNQPVSPPKPGNDRQGKIRAREGGIWVVELEGNFVVRATLAKNIQRPATGDRVMVRITGKGDTGEIRKLLQ